MSGGTAREAAIIVAVSQVGEAERIRRCGGVELLGHLSEAQVPFRHSEQVQLYCSCHSTYVKLVPIVQSFVLRLVNIDFLNLNLRFLQCIKSGVPVKTTHRGSKQLTAGYQQCYSMERRFCFTTEAAVWIAIGV